MSTKIPSLLENEEYYGIKILRDGTWLYGGTPIQRHNLVKLFASVLKKDDKGDYWLITPYERGRIEVEDVPFVIVEMKIETSGKSQDLLFRTNLDDWVRLDAEHPLRMKASAPYIMIRDGMEARINRAVYYDLVALAQPDLRDENTIGIFSGGVFFALGHTGDNGTSKE